MQKKWKMSIFTLFLVALSGAIFAFTGCTIFGCKNQVDQFAIRSFQECVDSGYLVIPADPPRCIVDKDHIFTKEPEFVRLNKPEPFDKVSSPLLIQGQARALNNTINYRLQSNDNVVLSEGAFDGNSEEHGRWGDIELDIEFDIPSVPSGTLFLFEYGQSWDDKNAVQIPLNFTLEGNLEGPEDEASTQASFQQEAFDPLQTLQSIDIPDEITLDVPFTPQAPFADWSDLYNEACEEASLIMVEYYLNDLELTRAKADLEIVELVEWQTRNNYAYDIDSKELVEVAQKYYQREAKQYQGDAVSLENIQRLLAGGYPVIIPAAGQLLGNPNFRGAGPPYHMLVITGYDENGFITNDPGTRNGEDFRYSFETIMNSIHDWIGTKDTIQQGPKAMVILRR